MEKHNKILRQIGRPALYMTTDFQPSSRTMLYFPIGGRAGRPDPVAGAAAVAIAELLPRTNLVLLPPLQCHRRRDQRAEDLMDAFSSTEN